MYTIDISGNILTSGFLNTDFLDIRNVSSDTEYFAPDLKDISDAFS